MCIRDSVQAIKNSVDQTYSVRDKRDERTTRTYMAFVFCVYAVLASIALVTVMNIVNSLSMSVSARMKQYGAMPVSYTHLDVYKRQTFANALKIK